MCRGIKVCCNISTCSFLIGTANPLIILKENMINTQCCRHNEIVAPAKNFKQFADAAVCFAFVDKLGRKP